MADRSVLITGCSSGIGLRLAHAFHTRGWQVLAGLRDPARAPEALAGMNLIELDLEDDAQIAAMAGKFDRLDCLVNNAGHALTGPFTTYSAQQMRRQMQVNMTGPAQLTQAVLPLLKQSRGRIISVSSLAGEAGMPMNSLYCASKHAVEGWAESLLHELAPHGIQVALVEPGGFRTRFAANMEWGNGAPSDAIEEQQLAGYRAMQDRMLAARGRDPAAVVDAIVGLAEMPTMPFRNRVGADACLMRQIKRWLPEALAMRMIGKAFRQRMKLQEPV